MTIDDLCRIYLAARDQGLDHKLARAIVDAVDQPGDSHVPAGA